LTIFIRAQQARSSTHFWSDKSEARCGSYDVVPQI